jgi:hypothetical protein
MLDVAGRRVRPGRRPRAADGHAPPDGAAPPDWVSHRFLDQLDTVIGRGLPVLVVYGRDDPYGRDFETARAGDLGRLLERAGGRVRVEVVNGRVHGVTSLATQEAVLAAVVDWAATDLLDAVEADAVP